MVPWGQISEVLLGPDFFFFFLSNRFSRSSSFSLLIRKMLYLTSMVFLFGDFLRSVVAVDCPGLPTTITDIQPALRTLLVANSSSLEEDRASVTVIVSVPFFTCQVQGTAVGTYQEVSLIVIYDSQGHNMNNVVGQFEMICIEISGNRLWDIVSNSLSTPGVDYTTIRLWTNCSKCVTDSPPNKNHCQREFQLSSDAPIWLKADIPIFQFFITDICRYR